MTCATQPTRPAQNVCLRLVCLINSGHAGYNILVHRIVQSGSPDIHKVNMVKVIPNPNLLSMRKAFDFAWITLKNHFGLFTAILLTFFATWVILEFIVVAGQRFGLFLWVMAHLGFFVIFAGMEIGLIRICLAFHDEKQIHYLDLFRELHSGMPFFFVQLVYFATVLIGFVLLIVPGAYLSGKYAFYAFHFAEGDSNLKDSFQQSAITSQGSLWFLFGFSVLLFILNILGASLLGAGLLITVPLSILMKTSIYRQLRTSGTDAGYS